MKNLIKKILSSIFPQGLHDELMKKYREYKFFGFSYKCPLCGGHFRKLLPAGFDFPVLSEMQIIGGGCRDNARCPRCNSSDRERLVYLYLKHKTNILDQERTRILHVAPEKELGSLLRKLNKGTYVSIDIDPSVADIQMDIRDLGFSDNSFDLIICNHVLEHVPEDVVAMRELYRVLGKGGKAILQVPISLVLEETFEDPRIQSAKEREQVFGQKDHVRIYAKDYTQRLKQAGFKVLVYNFASQADAGDVKKFAINAQENLYVCSK